MASRKNLKHAIHSEVEEMLFDLSILYSVAPEEREYAIEQIIMKVIDAERDFIARISHTDGKGERKLVRNYYNKLREEYMHFVNEVEGEVSKLCDELLVPEA
ncbi:hypothetical protein [Porphyromonas asaccharolytica]|uniref:Uncharacterized protein n=1 Tax=Porphyromonas asaccharolytica (strain ATCC 25260 / DSM 20707 / BCRC 10618 / CCUG 7834 / JCM 6326 / LMG 13178 / VPI 4198 / B440) TaxID=879243 RepID=F4KMF8_PORAD|nr:hypothetical protein [Porphyromonas asaccharolytica]AEE12277.1 hypothetical protein Poras_0323 [Porphyromonas asaccharolytica DSM 20707]